MTKPIDNIFKASHKMMLNAMMLDATTLIMEDPIKHRTRIWALVQKIKEMMDKDGYTKEEQDLFFRPFTEISITATLAYLILNKTESNET